jgi:hypothetical protein
MVGSGGIDAVIKLQFEPTMNDVKLVNQDHALDVGSEYCGEDTSKLCVRDILLERAIVINVCGRKTVNR